MTDALKIKTTLADEWDRLRQSTGLYQLPELLQKRFENAFMLGAASALSLIGAEGVAGGQTDQKMEDLAAEIELYNASMTKEVH